MQIISLFAIMISFLSMIKSIDLWVGGKCRGCDHALHFHHCLSLKNSAFTAQAVMQLPLVRAKL